MNAKKPSSLRALIASAIAASSLLAFPSLGAGSSPIVEAEPPALATQSVRVTFYLPTGNRMYSGRYPYVGAAACSWNYPIGTQLRFVADGWLVTCEDRGMLGYNGWVDVFVPNHSWGYANVEGVYGQYTSVIVERWGW